MPQSIRHVEHEWKVCRCTWDDTSTAPPSSGAISARSSVTDEDSLWILPILYILWCYVTTFLLWDFERFFFEGVLVLVSSVVSLSRQGLAKRGCGECKHARFSCKVVPHYLPGTEMSAWQEEDVIEAFVASLAAPSPAAPSPAVPLERQKRRQQERCRRMVLGFKEVGGNAIKRLGDCVCDGVGSARLLLFNFQSACICRTFNMQRKGSRCYQWIDDYCCLNWGTSHYLGSTNRNTHTFSLHGCSAIGQCHHHIKIYLLFIRFILAVFMWLILRIRRKKKAPFNNQQSGQQNLPHRTLSREVSQLSAALRKLGRGRPILPYWSLWRLEWFVVGIWIPTLDKPKSGENHGTSGRSFKVERI